MNIVFIHVYGGDLNKNKYCFKKSLTAQQVWEDDTWLVDYVLHAWYTSLLDCLLNMTVSSDVDGLPKCFSPVTCLIHWNWFMSRYLLLFEAIFKISV